MSRQAIRKKVNKEAEKLINSILSNENDEENVPRMGTNLFCNSATEEMLSSEASEPSLNVNLNESNCFSRTTSSPQNVEQVHQVDFVCFLREWSVKHSISVQVMNELLQKLNIFDINLPRDVRTLRETPRSTSVKQMGKGTYYHYGLQNCLTDFLYKTESSYVDSNKLILNFGVDGLPIFKSSKKCLWPILMSVSNYPLVFLVGVFLNVGSDNATDKYSKPSDPNVFLKYLIEDLKKYLLLGFNFNSKNYQIEVGHFVCDAPARAFLLNVKSHSGYYCCTKCKQKGEHYLKRIIFPCEFADLRTDESFEKRSQKEHHTVQKPLLLESLHIGCVSQFPLDYMHVVCLGATKQLLKLWIKTKERAFRLSVEKIAEISDGNIALSKQFCFEFNRVPRSLDEFERWKATEFRSFLLYSGVIVLQRVLDPIRYKHFCKLHVAIRILCDSELCLTYNEEAENLLKEFVSEVPELYGKECLTYNFHSLIHLNKDVLKYGCLDNFSAFKYENHLYSLKKKIKNGNSILPQLANRIIEESSCFKSQNKVVTYPILKGKIGENVYTTLQNESEKFSIRLPDNYVKIAEVLYIIKSIIGKSDGVYFVCKEVQNLEQFLHIDRHISNCLKIYTTYNEKYSEQDVLISANIIQNKYIRFNLNSTITFIPLLK